jgi:hypothetical protein
MRVTCAETFRNMLRNLFARINIEMNFLTPFVLREGDDVSKSWKIEKNKWKWKAFSVNDSLLAPQRYQSYRNCLSDERNWQNTIFLKCALDHFSTTEEKFICTTTTKNPCFPSGGIMTAAGECYGIISDSIFIFVLNVIIMENYTFDSLQANGKSLALKWFSMEHCISCRIFFLGDKLEFKRFEQSRLNGVIVLV